jgi:hypothetical protein
VDHYRLGRHGGPHHSSVVWLEGPVLLPASRRRFQVLVLKCISDFLSKILFIRD